MCDKQLANDGYAELGKTHKNEILDRVSSMASQPLRVLAFAYMQMDIDTWRNNFERHN